MPVPSRENERSRVLEVSRFLLRLSIGFWNCSYNVVFFSCCSQ